MKNKRLILFTILMIFATTFSANTESFTYISGTDSIKDFPPIFNADIQILANRRYESTSSPTINNDGVDTAGIWWLSNSYIEGNVTTTLRTVKLSPIQLFKRF